MKPGRRALLAFGVLMSMGACVREGHPTINSTPPAPQDLEVAQVLEVENSQSQSKLVATVTARLRCRSAEYGDGVHHIRRTRHPSRLTRAFVTALLVGTGVAATALSDDETARIGGFVGVGVGATLIFPYFQEAIDEIPLGETHRTEVEGFDRWTDSTVYDCGVRAAQDVAIRLTFGFSSTRRTLYYDNTSDHAGLATFDLGVIGALQQVCGDARITLSADSKGEEQTGRPSAVHPAVVGFSKVVTLGRIAATDYSHDPLATELASECIATREAQCRKTLDIESLRLQCASDCANKPGLSICSARLDLCRMDGGFRPAECIGLAESCAAEENRSAEYKQCMGQCEHDKLTAACQH